MHAQRYIGNPILSPDPKNPWEALAVLNGSPIEIQGVFHLYYRAIAHKKKMHGKQVDLSTIGLATGNDRVHFSKRRQLCKPEMPWEKFGCEDPRVTFFEGKYYIFYTALEFWPPTADGIKVAVAISSDGIQIEEKRLVTPFNAKAFALFPERVNGKVTAILSADTDRPPSKLAIAQVDQIEDFFNPSFWESWYKNIDTHILTLLRSHEDHVEVGAVPISLPSGFLLVYCYIQYYFTTHKIFGVEAALLDRSDPRKVLGNVTHPFIVPEKEYEQFGGMIPNVIFPSGALIHNGNLGVYYGAQDQTICVSSLSLDQVLTDMRPKKMSDPKEFASASFFHKYSENPIIKPVPERTFESRYTLNPGSVYLAESVHLLYRAQGTSGVSTLGYAKLRDGIHIDLRFDKPVYTPRIPEEKAGCEDPRLTIIGDRIYMVYTAYDGTTHARVALTSIRCEDFLQHNWKWDMPQIISPVGEFDKDACLFPEKIQDSYIFIHRLGNQIWLDRSKSLKFTPGHYLQGKVIVSPRIGTWDDVKVGLGAPPIKTAQGWFLSYHGISKKDNKYRMSAVLLDLVNPEIVIARIPEPILEPETDYENRGLRPGTVFVCGNELLDGQIFFYYGCADQYCAVASMNFQKLLNKFVYVRT